MPNFLSNHLTVGNRVIGVALSIRNPHRFIPCIDHYPFYSLYRHKCHDVTIENIIYGDKEKKCPLRYM